MVGHNGTRLTEDFISSICQGKECEEGDGRRKELSQPGDTEQHLETDQTSSQKIGRKEDRVVYEKERGCKERGCSCGPIEVERADNKVGSLMWWGFKTIRCCLYLVNAADFCECQGREHFVALYFRE